MREVTLLQRGEVQDPVVRAALQEIETASHENALNDVGAFGLSLVATANVATAQGLLGMGAFGISMAATADLAAARTLLGMGAFGITMAATATQAAAKTLLGIGTADNGFFHVNLNNVDQTVTAGVYTKLQFTTEVADTNGWFDNVTNYRFQPTVAGTYLIILGVSTTGAIGDDVQVGFYKNGAVLVYGDYHRSYSANNVYTNNSALISLNGSSDYVEGFAYSPTVTIRGGVTDTFMQGMRVV